MMFKDQVAIVTGGGQGIGRAICTAFANEGATVVVADIDLAQAQETVHTLEASESTALAVQTDVSCASALEALVQTVLARFNRIDILVNNAGTARDNIIMRMKEEDWDHVLNVNLKGCFNGIKAVSRPMIKNKNGRIINITSVIGQIGNAGQSNYAASKAGIIGLTKSIAKELGSRNITVNAVSPGYISTDMTDKLDEELKEKMKSSIPLGRLGTPQDVANLVCFLASDEAEYITGQTFNVDGGMVMI